MDRGPPVVLVIHFLTQQIEKLGVDAEYSLKAVVSTSAPLALKSTMKRGGSWDTSLRMA